MIKPDQVEGIQKSGTKKLKIDTDKENAEVKFKNFLLSLKTMMFSEDEAKRRLWSCTSPRISLSLSLQ